MQAQIDTSDVAYERRHRKYESFERRQRLREKEKLKHEQYKLKERIEQLRTMDVSAFLTLPASQFSPAPSIPEEDSEDGLTGLASTYINGAVVSNEGERRRKEMLDIALSLEERYRVLLPPERLRRLQSQPSTTRGDTTPGPLQAHTPVLPSRRADTSEPEREILIDDGYSRRQDKIRIKLKLGTNGSASQSPAPPGALRASKRSIRTSNPPQPLQKTVTRQRSRGEPSRSPTPPLSPRRLATAAQFTTYTSSEPTSPGVQADETLEEQGLASEVEEAPPRSDRRRSSASSEHKFGMELAMAVIRAQTLPSGPEPPTPPQKRSPLPNTRPAPAPEVNPVSLQQEPPLATNLEPLRSPQPQEAPLEGSPIRVDKGSPSVSRPVPISIAPRSTPSPPPIETLPNAASSPRAMEVEHTSTDLPSRHARHPEERSRLLELANAVHSITTTSPPSKRQKTWHHHPLPELLVPLAPAPASPPRTDQVDQASESERAPTPAAEQTSFSVLPTGETRQSSDEPMAVPKASRRSPSTPIAASTRASESVPPSAASAPASVHPSASTSLPTPEVIPSISVGAGPSGPRRRRPQHRRTEVEYKSDTGALRRTESLLLIAGIRGSLRQTQRHQMAFGVKVPEEISDPYDFWLPDEYLPEEELMKYGNYAYGVGDNAVVEEDGAGDGDSAMGQ